MICVECGRDIDEIGQDNMSSVSGRPLCEDCYFECGCVLVFQCEECGKWLKEEEEGDYICVCKDCQNNLENPY